VTVAFHLGDSFIHRIVRNNNVLNMKKNEQGFGNSVPDGAAPVLRTTLSLWRKGAHRSSTPFPGQTVRRAATPGPCAFFKARPVPGAFCGNAGRDITHMCLMSIVVRLAARLARYALSQRAKAH